MMQTFFRDLSFLVISLIIYDIFLLNRVITMYEAIFLTFLVGVYIFIIFKMNKKE